jgi:spore germination protein KB
MGSLMVLFELGTALIVIPTQKAGRDAWLSLLIGMPAGILLFLCYSSLHKRFPDISLPAYSRVLLGRPFGNIIGIGYVLFFMYGAARDLRDGTTLIDSMSLPSTPTVIIAALMVLVVVYVLYLGIEALGHTAVIYWGISIIIIITSTLLIFFSGIVDWHNLLPVAGDGWRKIVETGLTIAVIFPYGEMVCFTALLPQLDRKYSAAGIGISSILTGGFLLVGAELVTMSVLGKDVFERATYPLLTTIGKVEISDFISRLDVLVVISIIIGIFFKVSVLFYAALRSAEDVMHIPLRRLLLPFGLILLLSGSLIAPNWEEHIRESDFVLVKLYPVFAVVVPVLLLITAIIRQKSSNREGA